MTMPAERFTCWWCGAPAAHCWRAPDDGHDIHGCDECVARMIRMKKEYEDAR